MKVLRRCGKYAACTLAVALMIGMMLGIAIINFLKHFVEACDNEKVSD